MTPPTLNTVTVRRDKRLDPRLRRKNLQGKGDSQSVPLPPASYTPCYEVFTIPITSSSPTTSHSSSNPLPKSNTSQPVSSIKRRNTSLETSQRRKHRRIANQFCPKENRGFVEAKLHNRMHGCSTSSSSIQSLGRYLLRGYTIHKQMIIRAWQQIVWKIDRSSSLKHHSSVQNNLLAAFYVVNDAVGNAYNMKEFRCRFSNDVSVYAPTAFFYAGLIGTDSTISRLQRVLRVWCDRHYFKNQTIMQFSDMLDEGIYFGNICGRKNNFDTTKLWQNQAFQKMYNNLLKYCHQSLPSVAGAEAHFIMLIQNTKYLLSDLEPLLKLSKLARNYHTLNGIFNKLLGINAKAKAIGDNLRYISSVVIHLMMLSQFAKSAAMRSKKTQ